MVHVAVEEASPEAAEEESADDIKKETRVRASFFVYCLSLINVLQAYSSDRAVHLIALC